MKIRTGRSISTLSAKAQDYLGLLKYLTTVTHRARYLGCQIAAMMPSAQRRMCVFECRSAPPTRYYGRQSPIKLLWEGGTVESSASGDIVKYSYHPCEIAKQDIEQRTSRRLKREQFGQSSAIPGNVLEIFKFSTLGNTHLDPKL